VTALAAIKLRVAESSRHAGTSARLTPARIAAAAGARRSLRAYRVLDEQRLRATRRSDTIFIFGSGYSINDLTPGELEHFEAHDTLGFNWFVHQRLVRMDYHLVREIAQNDVDARVWRPQVASYFELVSGNPRYRDTIFLLQSGLRAINANRALAQRLVPQGSRVFLWRSVRGRDRLGRSFADGLSHPHSTLEECVNFAAILGWRKIVLVGVDLYDRRYFWLGAEETRESDAARGAGHAQPHSRATSGMIENLGSWARELAAQGTTLSVYNPRSLLVPALPLYAR